MAWLSLVLLVGHDGRAALYKLCAVVSKVLAIYEAPALRPAAGAASAGALYAIVPISRRRAQAAWNGECTWLGPLLGFNLDVFGHGASQGFWVEC